ncbi:MAG: hypothetical protein PHH49_02430 [Candidatus Omnitrophica bacterium]|nr:hypothetical protein [Candidatus Omnitrophota bacterium]MDD5487804.1 hypothetical protein [Candidatus Omnitrophota bacterium]
MLARIVGSLWIITGSVWLLKPRSLKSRLERKVSRGIRRTVTGGMIAFGLMMVASAFKAHGIYAKMIMVAGLVLMIKAIALVTSRTSDMFFKWLGSRPIALFRLWAALMILMGAMMLYVK